MSMNIAIPKHPNFKYSNRSAHHYWLVRCDCGKEKIISGSDLRFGKTVSCDCYHTQTLHDRKIDIAGQQFYEWTVIRFGYIRKGNRII